MACARTFHRLLAKIGHDVLPDNTMSACKALMRGQIDNNPATLLDALNTFAVRIRDGVAAHDQVALARANPAATHETAQAGAGANATPTRVTPTLLKAVLPALVNEASAQGTTLSKLPLTQISQLLGRKLNVAHEPSPQLSQLVMHHYRDVTGWRSEKDSRLLRAYRLVNDYVAQHYPGGIADDCTPPESGDIDSDARTPSDITYIRYAIAAHFGWNPQGPDGLPRAGDVATLSAGEQQAVLNFISCSGSAIPREIASQVFHVGSLNPLVDAIEAFMHASPDLVRRGRSRFYPRPHDDHANRVRDETSSNAESPPAKRARPEESPSDGARSAGRGGMSPPDRATMH